LSTTSTTKKDTKTAIMDAAETMMAEHGINGVSIRAILTEAGANSAALHYHFKNKEGLIEKMITRHGKIPTLRRREMIADFKASSATPTPNDIVNFIVEPMILLLEERGEAARRFYRFIARLQSDRTGIHRLVEEKHFPEIKKHLHQMLQEACPLVTVDELEIRLTMMIDTLLQSLSNAEFMSKEWDDDGHHDELKLFAARLKTFLSGGLAARAT